MEEVEVATEAVATVEVADTAVDRATISLLCRS